MSDIQRQIVFKDNSSLSLHNKIPNPFLRQNLSIIYQKIKLFLSDANKPFVISRKWSNPLMQLFASKRRQKKREGI